MKRTITTATAGFFLFFSSLQAQTTCSDDRVAYVNSKNVGAIGAYTLSIGLEERGAQTYHYSGPGKVGGAKVYGHCPTLFQGVKLRVSLYNVGLNGRPTGSSIANSPLQDVFSWSPASFDVSFSPAVSVNSNFAVVVEVVNLPGWGHDFELQYTGNNEGLGEDLASLGGTSTAHNWVSAMTDFNKDGDFYIYPRMINFNTPLFTLASSCASIGETISFTNTTQMTLDSMFNKITASGYAGTNYLYAWDFGDGSPVLNIENPSHAYSTAGAYTVVLTSTIEGWDGICSKTYSKTISVGLAADYTAVTSVSCNGGSDGSIIASGSGGETPYTYSIYDRAYQLSNSFTGLEYGMYTLYVKDAIGCIQTKSFVITEPTAIQIGSATSTNSSCGSSDGSLLVIASGGIGSLQYQNNSGSFQPTGTFTGLSAAAYDVTVKDANNCTASKTVIVNDAGGPSFDIINSTAVSCFGSNDGSISLSSLGGTGNIQYSINGGNSFQSSGIFSNLSYGNYVLIVKDAAGCSDIQLLTIKQPQHLFLVASSIPLTCFGSEDGQINVTAASGGIGTIKYSLDGINFQSGSNFPNLSAGVYTVYAKDIASCMHSISVTVNQPTQLNVAVSTTDASCNGFQNGVISVVASGGTPGYLYGIGEDDEPQSIGNFYDLSAGNYSLYVVDKNGCRNKTSGTILEPSVIVPIATATNSTCGNSNGGLLVTATGGSGLGYTYSLNGGAYGAGSFSLLDAATYVITAQDNLGCNSSINVSINNSDGPVIGAGTNHTNVNCNGGSDGTITVGSVTGGTGNLQYSVNGTSYQSSPIFNRLAAGEYNVTVKDAVGCIGNVTITITEPNAILVTTSTVDVLCSGSLTGSVSMLVGGGSGTLNYSIDDGNTFQLSNTFSGLAAGTYGLLVKDAGNCYGETTVVISQPKTITFQYSSLNVSCNGLSDGTLNVFARGGVASFQYSLGGTSYQSSNVFTGLAGGAYTVYVKDGNNCVVSNSVSVLQPAILTVGSSITDVSCYGGNNGIVNITVVGGTPNYYFDWSNGAVSEDNSNLSFGSYDVTVSDGNGCAVSIQNTVTQPALPLIVNGTVTDASLASNGAIDVTASGGTVPYTYLWSNNSILEDLTGLAPASYSVGVTDALGCAASSTFLVVSTLGISSADLANNQVSVYPSPANDHVVVEMDGLTINKIEVYDIVGKVVYSAAPKKSKTEINTTEFKQGIYFVKILSGENWVTKKINIIK